MAGLKEIKRRLRTVRSTRKITYAMKLVSAAKLRRVQEAVTQFRLYTFDLSRILAQIESEKGKLALMHPLMVERNEVKTIALIVIGGQRGLCGGYNTNLNRRCHAAFEELQGRNPGSLIASLVLGKKAADFYRRTKKTFEHSYENLPENAAQWPVDEVSRMAMDGFLGGRFDEVWMVYTRFRSAISMKPEFERLLPLATGNLDQTGEALALAPAGSTIFEPGKLEIFSAIMPRIVNAKVRQACLDAKASETASRMTAMDSATRNAGELARKLELTGNKLRQQKITSELLDIIGGANAL